MKESGYVDYARITFGVHKTLAEATEDRQAFFDLYPKLLVWHDRQKNYARTHKCVRSPLGRIRHLPLINSPDQEARAQAERQAINSPVQATLSDLSIYSLAKFEEKYGTNPDCRFFLFTHDSITAYVKKSEVQRWVPNVSGIMENLPLKETFGWDVPIPFPVEAEVGTNLGEIKEYEVYLHEAKYGVHKGE